MIRNVPKGVIWDPKRALPYSPSQVNKAGERIRRASERQEAGREDLALFGP